MPPEVVELVAKYAACDDRAIVFGDAKPDPATTNAIREWLREME